MFGLGMPELIVVMVIVMVLFGGKKLPEMGRGIGQAIRNFKSATKTEVAELEDAIKMPEEKKEKAA